MAGADCSFGVLGPLVLERDHADVPLPSGHQRSLLALLLLAGGVPLSRDRLIDELWGEQPPASAVSAMHVHLSKLRALLGGLLVRRAGRLRARTGDFELDVWRFDALVEQAARRPGAGGRTADRGAGPVSRRAAVRCRLRGERRAVATDVGGEATAGDGAADRRRAGAGARRRAVAELERLTDEHPFEEQLWGQLMLALYRAGRQADALEAYQRIRRRFAEELGMEPGEPLARLQQRILARDPTLARPAPDSPRSPRGPASNLPRPPTRLVGREHELRSCAVCRPIQTFG